MKLASQPSLTPVEILRALVAIPTVSSFSNLPLLDWVTAFLQPRGWSCRLLRYADEKGVEKANLIARPAPVEDPDRIDLAFLCHTDTVPPAVGWRDPHTLHVADGHANGLGACDVKSALACFLAAVASLPHNALHPGVALLLTADEEIGCKGMERLLAALPALRIRCAIISEPTSLRPAVAGKGYGLARVVVRGREAHSAFPREGISAIAAAAALIPCILAASSVVAHPLFDPPTTTFNVGTITGGTAKNILPGECSFLIEWRAVPNEPTGAIAAQLQQIIRQATEKTPGITAHFELLRDEPGFGPNFELSFDPACERACDRADASSLADHLSAALHRDPTGISFGSEATRVARIAEEVVVLGPGDMRTAHSDRECVPLAELDEWMHTLQSLLWVAV